MSTVRGKVPCLRLHVCFSQALPFQVLFCELSVRRRLGLLGDGLDGFGAIDRLLSAGNISQPAWLSDISKPDLSSHARAHLLLFGPVKHA